MSREKRGDTRPLPREVVAAIETAVDRNDGVLESAYIHSLAKIYKTSPQAVVYNMRRYNKVKAGCDDRQKGGRKAAMDKSMGADYLRELMAEAHNARENLKISEITERYNQHFGVELSTTWISRVMTKNGIPLKGPKPEKVKKIRIPKPPKPPKAPKATKNPRAPMSSFTPQYTLPAPGEYPSFREDLQQAMATAPVVPRPIAVEPPVAMAVPPAKRVPKPRLPQSQAHPPDFEGFGILRLSTATAPSPFQTQHSIPPQYQHPPSVYPPRYTPAASASTSYNSTPTSEVGTHSPDNPRPVARPPSTAVDWEVVQVVELP